MKEETARVQVQVFGAGSLGTLLGALLSRAGVDTHLVARERVVEAFEDGVRVEGTENFVARPSISTEPRPAEVTLVTVKSYDTPEAADALASVVSADDTVVSLQNGMCNEEVLDEALEATVLGGTTTYGANLRLRDGFIEYTGRGEVVVGDYRGDASPKAESVAETLAPLNARYTDEMDAALWEKLAVNCAINPVTALTRLKNGEAAERAPEVMRAAARETAEVAHENGVRVEGAPERALEVARATAENESSTLQDVRAGRRTEIDALNGYVVRTAEDVDVPTNATLLSLVRALSRTK
ncbi:MAG: ketopantoate reductase family protein [Halobacteriales archaeon]|nr:ketopantoate reductase family protein [Halobacteriales archaeon]